MKTHTRGQPPLHTQNPEITANRFTLLQKVMLSQPDSLVFVRWVCKHPGNWPVCPRCLSTAETCFFMLQLSVFIIRQVNGYTFLKINMGEPVRVITKKKKKNSKNCFILVLVDFYRGGTGINPTRNITKCHEMCSAQDRTALQRVIKTDQNIINIHLPSISDSTEMSLHGVQRYSKTPT